MMDMNLPIFSHLKKACREKNEECIDTLGPLAYVMFHVSQSTEGCREDKLISGRDTDDMETNLSEFLASFVIYSGDAISKS